VSDATRGHRPAGQFRHGRELAVPRRAGADHPAPGRAGRRAGGRARGADQGRGARELGRRAATTGERGAPGGMTEITLNPDGVTITVFVPIAWRRRGGQKVIVTPPGCNDWAPPP